MVRWMMAARKNGRWGNTQENALAMEALVAYYRKYEAEVPDFTRRGASRQRQAAGAAGVPGPLGDGDDEAVPMQTLLASGPAGDRADLTFAREGTGTLFYTARLRYAVDALLQRGPRQRLRDHAHVRADRSRREGRHRPGRDDATRPAIWSASR